MINTSSYGTVTDADVRETQRFVARTMRELKKLPNDQARKAYLDDVLRERKQLRDSKKKNSLISAR